MSPRRQEGKPAARFLADDVEKKEVSLSCKGRIRGTKEGVKDGEAKVKGHGPKSSRTAAASGDRSHPAQRRIFGLQRKHDEEGENS